MYLNQKKAFVDYFINYINSSIILDLQSFKFLDLINIIKKITNDTDIILIIDEVDKASNNKLFLEFLGMLRSLYLIKSKGIVLHLNQ